MSTIGDGTTIRALLERRAATDRDRPYLRFAGETITFAQMDAGVNRLANALAGEGLGAGDRVAVMLPNHPDHVRTFLAAAKLGLVQIPVNINLKGSSLEYLFEHSRPRAVIADSRFAPQLAPALARARPEVLVWRGGALAAAAGGP
ncbi:MAG: AMP-binding protein, partial [Alphaproteobacteria bacterium]